MKLIRSKAKACTDLPQFPDTVNRHNINLKMLPEKTRCVCETRMPPKRHFFF